MAFPLGKSSYYKNSIRFSYLPLYGNEFIENCHLNKNQRAKVIGFINDYANFLFMFGDILNIQGLKRYFKHLYVSDSCKSGKETEFVSDNVLDRIYNILARGNGEYAYDYITDIIKIDKDLYIFSFKK